MDVVARTAALGLLFLAVGVAPVAAHGGRGPLVAGDYRATVRVVPLIADLRVAVLEGDSRVWLRAPTGRTIIVEGFAGEPFLRVTDSGVWVNDRSPQAHVVGMARVASPMSLDPATTPSWRRIGDGPIAVWHDHRLAPPVDPSSTGDAVGQFTIPLRVDGVADELVGVRVHGTPPPLALLLGAVGLIGLAGLLAPSRGRIAVATTLATAAAGAMAAAGTANAIAGPHSTLATGVAVAAVLGIVVFLPFFVAAAPARWRPPLAGLSGLTAAFLAAGESAVLAHPFANSALPSVAVRALVVVAIGGGLASAAATARVLPWRAWWSSESP